MSTHLAAVVGLCVGASVLGCGGGEPPLAVPPNPAIESDSGAFAMPSPAQSEAVLREGGSELIVDAGAPSPLAMGVATTDVDAGAGAMAGHAHALMGDAGAARHKMDHGKGAASKTLADGGAPKKK